MANHQHESALQINQVRVAVCLRLTLNLISWNLQADHITEVEVLKTNNMGGTRLKFTS